MDDDNDNSIELSPEKNTKKSTKRMKEEIKIKGIRRSKKSTIEGKEIILSNNDFIKYKEKDNEKKAINNNKESYYRIEKLLKEDKGKKGGKIYIDYPNGKIEGTSINLEGWSVCSSKTCNLKTYIDDKEVNYNYERIKLNFFI